MNNVTREKAKILGLSGLQPGKSEINHQIKQNNNFPKMHPTAESNFLCTLQTEEAHEHHLRLLISFKWSLPMDFLLYIYIILNVNLECYIALSLIT